MSIDRPLTSTEAALFLVLAFDEFELMVKETVPREQIFGACLLFNRILRRTEAYIPNDPGFEHVHRLMQEVRSLTFGIHDYNKLKGE